MHHLDWLHWALISILTVLVIGGGIVIFALNQMVNLAAAVLNPFSSKTRK